VKSIEASDVPVSLDKDAAWSERVIGVALSEFDPARDRNDQSLGTLV
jgi:hypothetical protein